jgi:poly(hydroxyalkanoate) depolymerase family esterase
VEVIVRPVTAATRTNTRAGSQAAFTSAVATRVMLTVLLMLVAGVAAVSGPALETAQAAGATEVPSFGTNPGALKMFRYVPSGLPAGAPMVVAMHGCTQSAAAYDDEPGWVALAERWKFAVVLPEQQASNNSSRCFNWFQGTDITRDSGEALSIKQMVDKTKADLGSNPARIFVTGLSAGGVMTSVMLATYPDVFAGGAIMAGIPFGCATTVSAAFSCMNPGVDKTPRAWGDLVRSATAYTGIRPTVQIWQGTSDSTVRPLNMTELVDQWTNVAGADQTAAVQETVAGYPHSIYRDASGRNAVELYSITGMDHGTPVDPGTGPTQCGTAAPYILDVNICSSYYIAKSWGLDSGAGDSTTGSMNATFASRSAEDGYVKANADGSSASVGLFESTYGIASGRGTDNMINKSLLSFDTSSVPDGATVTAADVTITYANSFGDPWASPPANKFVLDVRNGCFALCSTEAGDWAAPATAGAVADIAKLTSGTTTSGGFNAAGLAAVNKAGLTQVRLAFAANPPVAYVFIQSGAAATLHLTWQ